MTRLDAKMKFWTGSNLGLSARCEKVIKLDEFNRFVDEIFDHFECRPNCPELETEEQCKLFIYEKETDIKNISLAIEQAKQKLGDIK